MISYGFAILVTNDAGMVILKAIVTAIIASLSTQRLFHVLPTFPVGGVETLSLVVLTAHDTCMQWIVIMYHYQYISDL